MIFFYLPFFLPFFSQPIYFELSLTHKKDLIYSLLLHHLLKTRMVAQVGRLIAIRSDVPALLRRTAGLCRCRRPLGDWKGHSLKKNLLV